MNLIKRLLILISTFINFNVFAYPYFSISTDNIGPYQKNEIAYIDVYVTSNLPTVFKMSLHVLIDNELISDSLIFSSNFEEYLITTRHYKVKLNTNYLTESENIIKFQLINVVDHISYSSAEMKLLLNMNQSQNISDLKFGNYDKTYYVGKITNNNAIYYDDKTKFMFPKIHKESAYYRLDLSNYKLLKKDSTLIYDEAILKIHDPRNVFEYLGSGTNKYIPLKFNKNRSTFYLTFKNYMYVNPKTMQMSLIPRNNFLQTKYFYFPINKKDKLDNTLIRIEFNGYGHLKTDVYLNSKLTFENNLIGSCDNSDFCITGGIFNG